MPGPHHNHHPAGKTKHSRYTPPKANLGKALRTRWEQVDQTTLLTAANLIIVATSLLTAVFNLRVLYKLDLLCLTGVHGHACWKAFKASGKKLTIEMIKEPSMPYFLLSLFMMYLSRTPMLPMNVSFALFGCLALYKLLTSSQAAQSNPALKAQFKQLTEGYRVLEPKFLALASHAEILAVPWSLIGAVRGSQSIFLPVLLMQLVRFLHMSQARMQSAWKAWAGKGEAAVAWVEAQPGLPPTVRQVLLNTKLALSNSSSAPSAPSSSADNKDD